MKQIILAKSAGFCFGVRRSVEMAEELLEQHGSCLSFGELIHNEDVVKALESKGMKVVSSADEMSEGDHVIIRAHGISGELQKKLEATGAQISDATCPKVKNIHKIVAKAKDEGRFVVIIGMRRHPEVEAICGRCGEYVVLENAAEVDAWLDQNPDFLGKALTVVVQTTQTSSNFTECCNIIKKRCTNTKISDTICSATSTRQEEAANIASQCDAMVVIGGKHSANSRHLAQICAERCGCVQVM